MDASRKDVISIVPIIVFVKLILLEYSLFPFKFAHDRHFTQSPQLYR